MSVHVYETVKKFADQKGIQLSSFGWSNVRAIEREAQSGNLSNLQIVDRLKREGKLRFGFDRNDWEQMSKQWGR